MRFELRNFLFDEKDVEHHVDLKFEGSTIKLDWVTQYGENFITYISLSWVELKDDGYYGFRNYSATQVM